MKEEKCLVPNCNNNSHIRGLCKKHYSRVRYLISSKKIAEKTLLENKKILPKAKTRKNDDWFLQSQT